MPATDADRPVPLAAAEVVHVNSRNDAASVGPVLVAGLRSAGVAAALLEPDTPGTTRGRRASYLYVPQRLAILGGTVRALRRAAPPLVHVHNARHAVIARASGRPYVVHCHGTDIRGTRPGRGWGLELAPLLRGARLVLVSTVDLLPDAARYVDEPVFLPNPVPVARFAPPAAPVPQRDVLVGVALTPVKGVDRVVAVARAIREARPGTSFTVVDQGQDLGPILAALGDAATVVPRVGADRLPALLHGHRLALGQMKLGALGVFELECLAAGVPIVMPAPWNRRHEEPAPIVDADGDTGLAAGALALLDDEEARQERSRAGRHWVARWHELSAVVDRLVELYRSIGVPVSGRPLGTSR